MKLVDANVLIYAVNESAPHHDEAREWLDGALDARESVGFSWVALLAFVRLTTKAGLFPSPLPLDRALEVVRGWVNAPPAVVVEPGVRHLEVLSGLLSATGIGGNLTNDAHLAALALEHRGAVVTYDSDFGRFPGVAWSPPSLS